VTQTKKGSLRLNNISLKVKLFLPLALTLLLIVGLLVVSSNKDAIMVETQDQLMQEDIGNIVTAGRLLESMYSIDGQFYQLLINHSTGNISDGVEQMGALKDNAVALEKELLAFMDDLPSGSAQAMQEVYEAFQKNITGQNDDGVYDIAMQMMGIDVSFVLKGIDAYTDTFNTLVSTLETVQSDVRTAAEQAGKQSQDDIEVLQNVTLTASVGLSVLLVIISSVVTLNTLRSITEISKATTRLASGDTDIDIDVLERGDELGQIVDSLGEFKVNQQEVQRLTEEQERAKQEQEEERKAQMTKLADEFDQRVSGTIQNLIVASEKLKTSSVGLSDTVQQSQKASSDVSSFAKETSENVSTVSAATEEMNASATEISNQVASIVTKMQDTSHDAETTSSEVDNLQELTHNIGTIVTAIRDIADQTNLLALNATIEAARAGDAGKGFAVVADEVKKLANETGAKTEEIATRVQEIQKATNSSVESVQRIIVNIRDISEATNSTAAAVEEQDVVIRDITSNIVQVSDATQEVVTSIDEVEVASNRTNDASESLSVVSQDIAGLCDALGGSVNDFLSYIRSDSAEKKGAA